MKAVLYPSTLHLESKDLVLKLRNWLSLLEAQTLSRLLHRANHRWWTAKKDLNIIRSSWELLLNHLWSNKPNTTSPASRWVVKHVVNTETWVLLCKRIQVLAEENILLVNVGEEKVDLCLITSSASADNSTDNLQHWGNSGSASDHTKVANHVWGVNHGALWTLDLDLLADLESCKVLGDVAGWVGLDEQVEGAWLVVAGNRGVGAHDFLGDGLAFFVGNWESGGDGDVLADREAEDRGWGWESEAVDGDVVGDDSLLGHLKLLELLGEDWLAACTRGKDLEAAERQSKRNSIWKPFSLNNRRSNDQKTRWNINAIHHSGGSPLVRHLANRLNKFPL